MFPNFARRSARRLARRLVRSGRGATMAEYALVLGVIALVAVVGARALGNSMRNGANRAASFINSI